MYKSEGEGGKINLTLSAPETKIEELANSVDPNEAPLCEPPHQDPHCLPSSL